MKAVCVKSYYDKQLKRSFPNKRILRNNLCLPACRILVYKKMTLEI